MFAVPSARQESAVIEPRRWSRGRTPILDRSEQRHTSITSEEDRTRTGRAGYPTPSSVVDF